MKKKTTKMRMRSSRRWSLAPVTASILIFACSFALTAQKKKDTEPSTRTLQGTVTGATGNPIEQAVVQLKDTRTLQVSSFITKEDGMYHFSGLRLDSEYQVRAERNDLHTDWKRISVFDPRKVVVVNFKLEKK